jgi:hypothetical protein
VLSPATGVESEGEHDRVSNRDRLKLTPNLTTRWATGNDNFAYSSPWDFKSSFTFRKILRHWTFPLYFPSERKVCCRFLSPLKIHRLGRVLNPQPLGPVTSTLTTTPPRRRSLFSCANFATKHSLFYKAYCVWVKNEAAIILLAIRVRNETDFLTS